MIRCQKVVPSMFIELHFGHFEHKLPKFTIRDLEGVFCELALPLAQEDITINQISPVKIK